MQRACLFVGEDEAVLRQANRRCHHSAKTETAVVRLRVDEAGDSARNPGGLWTLRGHARNHVALRVEIHVRGGGSRRLFAKVKEVRRAMRKSRRRWPDEHEAATTEIAGIGKGDGEREGDSDRGIHGIAARAQNLDSRVRGVMLNAHDHCMLRSHRWSRRNRIARLRCRLRESTGCKQSQSCGGEEFAAKRERHRGSESLKVQ